MAHRGAHNYTNSHISGHSRAHLGDVHNHYGPSPDERLFHSVLESLRYDGMDDRRDRLSGAERGTFEWTLAEEKTANADHEDNNTSGTHEQGDEEDVLYSVIRSAVSKLNTTAIDTSFASWLEGKNEDLFCFMGIPGSGKSTLMYEASMCDPVNGFGTDGRINTGSS